MKKHVSILATMSLVGFFASFTPPFVHANDMMRGVSLGEFSLGCDYYLIEDSTGSYTLVEWYGGTTTYRGDEIVGDLHTYGFEDYYDISIGQSTHVWIDDWLLSQNRASEKLIDKCGWDSNILDYFSGTNGNSYSDYATCPANSHVNPSNRDKCLCDDGYAINSDKTECVPVLSCPTHSTGIWGSCVCETGYFWNEDQDRCVTYTQTCQLKLGLNSHGDKDYCYCNSGYKMNPSKTACIATPLQRVNSSSSHSVLSTPSIPICAKNSSLIGTDCICNEGYAPFKNACIWIPENAHAVTSNTDAWKCDDGYIESGNFCIEILKGISGSAINSVESSQSSISSNKVDSDLPTGGMWNPIWSFFFK